MKTSCPICGFETEVLDEKIRKRGRNVTCPNCEHTYFVERSIHRDLDIIKDSAGLDIIHEVRPALEREQRYEENEETKKDKGNLHEDVATDKVKGVIAAIMIIGFGIYLMFNDEIPDDIPIDLLIIAVGVLTFLIAILRKG